MSITMTGRRACLRLLLCCALCFLALTSGLAFAQTGGELRFCLRSEPKTFDPLLVDDDSSLSIRYLTGGVLVRVNRHTQELEPELAESWKVSNDGKQITFKLRHGVHVLRRQPVFRRGRCLHHAAAHGSRAALLDRRCFPLRQRRRQHQDACARPDHHYFSRTACRTRSPLRSGRDHVRAFSPKGSGRARALYGCGIQSGIERAPAPQSQLLEKRFPGTPLALSRFHPARHSIESRRRDAALQTRRTRPDQRRSTASTSTAWPPLRPNSRTMPDLRSIPISCGSTRWRALPFPSTSAPGSAPLISGARFLEAINRDDLSRVVFNGHAQPAVGPGFARQQILVQQQTQS